MRTNKFTREQFNRLGTLATAIHRAQALTINQVYEVEHLCLLFIADGKTSLDAMVHEISVAMLSGVVDPMGLMVIMGWVIDGQLVAA